MSADNYGRISHSGTFYELRSFSASADEGQDPGALWSSASTLDEIVGIADGEYFEYGWRIDESAALADEATKAAKAASGAAVSCPACAHSFTP